jgi:hypothetical protein
MNMELLVSHFGTLLMSSTAISFLLFSFFLTFPIVRYSRKQKKTMFRKLEVFPSSGEGKRHLLSWAS